MLIVEDDEDSRDNMADLLRDEGFDVRTACDGLEALDQLSVTSLPDAMVLDLRMPRMSGGEVLAHVQSTPAMAHLPVCILSGSIDEAPPGADLVVEKPLLVHRLVQVQRWLHECVAKARKRLTLR